MIFGFIKQWMIWLFAGLLMAACSNGSSTAPTPPVSGLNDAANKNTQTKTPSKDSDSEDSLTDNDRDDAKNDSPDYLRGGAPIGTEEQLEKLEECLDDGKFYQRFIPDDPNSIGSCTRMALANVDCTEDGIVEQLSDAQKNQFLDALDNQYRGYEVDQCVDCPPGTTNDVCRGGDGYQTGTKVYFISDQGTEILGRTILLPIRPNQDESSAE